MSLECYFYAEYYVDLSYPMVVSLGTEFCVECGRLIPFQEPHYQVKQWQVDEWDEQETVKAWHTCCEECGDLALSFMDLGYCWTFGELRNDIQEMNGW